MAPAQVKMINALIAESNAKLAVPFWINSAACSTEGITALLMAKSFTLSMLPEPIKKAPITTKMEMIIVAVGI